MSKEVKAIPEGYHSITPYLIIKDAAQALEFYRKAFGAVEVMKICDPSGKVGHAEIKIGDSHLMVADEYPDMKALSPKTLGGAAVSLMLYVPDADASVERAVAAGGKLARPVKDQFYGDRSGSVEDPFGYTWHISTHIEDLSLEEIQKRAAEAYS